MCLLLRVREVPGSDLGPGTICVVGLFEVFVQKSTGVIYMKITYRNKIGVQEVGCGGYGLD